MRLGIDLGGTKIAAAVVDVSSGRVVAEQAIPTNSRAGPDAVLTRMADLVLATCNAAGTPLAEIMAIGLGVPGPFDQESGRIVFLPNLIGMWRDVPVRAIRSERGSPGPGARPSFPRPAALPGGLAPPLPPHSARPKAGRTRRSRSVAAPAGYTGAIRTPVPR